MTEVSGAERAAEITQADIRTKGWLQRMFAARQALQEAVAGREAANFDGMIQGFNELPAGASLEVVPEPGVKLEARRYDTGFRQSASLSYTYYSRRLPVFYHSDGPFEGGALILAKLEEVTDPGISPDRERSQALIGLSFHCLRPGPVPIPRGMAVNQVLDGVFVPGDVPFETTFRVVDTPPILSKP